MKFSRLCNALLVLLSPKALAHGGEMHLDEETLEAIFQFLDRTYAAVLARLPLIAGIALGLALLWAGVKILRRTR
jgi:hypothetical protein